MMWLFLAGLLCTLFGMLLLLVAMFRVHFLWGLFGFFFPPVQWLFILMHWGRSWRPLLVQAVGLVVVVGSVWFSEPWQMLTQQYQVLKQFQAMQPGWPAPDPADGARPFPAEPGEEVVPVPPRVYECVDAQGQRVYQDRPCTP